MQKGMQKEDDDQLKDQAITIAVEIFNLINKYTNDSNVSKFFLSDEISHACYGLAGGFSSVVYTPALQPEQVKNKAILSFYYTLMTYGFNIYLRERSILTNASPYMLTDDKKIIKKAQKKVLSLTSKGKLISTPLADRIIDILLENINKQMSVREFTIPKHRLDKTKYFDYAKLSLYWGYNFARELLTEKQNNKD